MSCEVELARPLDPLYYGAYSEGSHRPTVDLFGVTRYNAIVKEMSDQCWECSHGPIRYGPICRNCVKRTLNKDLPNINKDEE